MNTTGGARRSGASPAAGARLFVAVWPPSAVVEALAAVPVGDGRRTPAERLHVTLRFLGQVGEAGQARVLDALAPAVAAAPSAVGRLAAATATFGRHVLHVPVAGLDELAAAVMGSASDVGAAGGGPDARPFVGHLTVARSRGRSSAGDLRAVAGAPVPEAARAPWAVGEVTLVASAGGRYEVLARFPTA